MPTPIHNSAPSFKKHSIISLKISNDEFKIFIHDSFLYLLPNLLLPPYQITKSNVFQKIGITLLQFAEIAKPVAIVYCILGIGVGIIGSSMSMRKYLEV